MCLCKLVAGAGQVSRIGVRRSWRGRGLGLQLPRHAFGELQRRGVCEVVLNVDGESATGAPRVYARAGLRVTRTYTMYRKELRAGYDLSAEPGGAG